MADIDLALIPIGILVLAVIAAAGMVLFLVKLGGVWLPRSWGAAVAWYNRAASKGRWAQIAYLAAWILLFPLMVLACLAAAPLRPAPPRQERRTTGYMEVLERGQKE